MGCGCSTKAGGYAKPKEIETKWFHDFEAMLPALEKKIVCVTGCTSGTGFICLRTAARKGAHVVMLNRKSARAESALERVIAEVPGATVTAINCDLQSFESVRAAAKELHEKFSDTGIDVLCNNAGVMALPDEATQDGYDIQMQTNHLSHFLLTKELYPLLTKAAQQRGEARVVNHSSAARKFPNKTFDAKYLGRNGGDLGGNGNSALCGGARWQRYHQSKLANVVFTLAFHDRLRAAESKLKAVCAAPGFAATNLQVTSNSSGGMSETWAMRWAQSAEDGTMPLLQCCFGHGVESGDFWEPQGRANLTGLPAKIKLEPVCTKLESRKLLWDHSEQACGAFVIS